MMAKPGNEINYLSTRTKLVTSMHNETEFISSVQHDAGGKGRQLANKTDEHEEAITVHNAEDGLLDEAAYPSHNHGREGCDKKTVEDIINEARQEAEKNARKLPEILARNPKLRSRNSPIKRRETLARDEVEKSRTMEVTDSNSKNEVTSLMQNEISVETAFNDERSSKDQPEESTGTAPLHIWSNMLASLGVGSTTSNSVPDCAQSSVKRLPDGKLSTSLQGQTNDFPDACCDENVNEGAKEANEMTYPDPVEQVLLETRRKIDRSDHTTYSISQSNHEIKEQAETRDPDNTSDMFRQHSSPETLNEKNEMDHLDAVEQVLLEARRHVYAYNDDDKKSQILYQKSQVHSDMNNPEHSIDVSEEQGMNEGEVLDPVEQVLLETQQAVYGSHYSVTEANKITQKEDLSNNEEGGESVVDEISRFREMEEQYEMMYEDNNVYVAINDIAGIKQSLQGEMVSSSVNRHESGNECTDSARIEEKTHQDLDQSKDNSSSIRNGFEVSNREDILKRLGQGESISMEEEEPEDESEDDSGDECPQDIALMADDKEEEEEDESSQSTSLTADDLPVIESTPSGLHGFEIVSKNFNDGGVVEIQEKCCNEEGSMDMVLEARSGSQISSESGSIPGRESYEERSMDMVFEARQNQESSSGSRTSSQSGSIPRSESYEDDSDLVNNTNTVSPYNTPGQNDSSFESDFKSDIDVEGDDLSKGVQSDNTVQSETGTIPGNGAYEEGNHLADAAISVIKALSLDVDPKIDVDTDEDSLRKDMPSDEAVGESTSHLDDQHVVAEEGDTVKIVNVSDDIIKKTESTSSQMSDKSINAATNTDQDPTFAKIDSSLCHDQNSDIVSSNESLVLPNKGRSVVLVHCSAALHSNEASDTISKGSESAQISVTIEDNIGMAEEKDNSDMIIEYGMHSRTNDTENTNDASLNSIINDIDDIGSKENDYEKMKTDNDDTLKSSNQKSNKNHVLQIIKGESAIGCAFLEGMMSCKNDLISPSDVEAYDIADFFVEGGMPEFPLQKDKEDAEERMGEKHKFPEENHMKTFYTDEKEGQTAVIPGQESIENGEMSVEMVAVEEQGIIEEARSSNEKNQMNLISEQEDIESGEESVERTLSFKRLQMEKGHLDKENMAEQARRVEMEELLGESKKRLEEEEREKMRLLAKADRLLEEYQIQGSGSYEVDKVVVIPEQEDIENKEDLVERTPSFERLKMEKRDLEEERKVEQARIIKMERLLEDSQNRLVKEEREKMRLLAKAKEEDKAVHDSLLAEVTRLRREVETAEAARRGGKVLQLKVVAEETQEEMDQDETVALTDIGPEITNKTVLTAEVEGDNHEEEVKSTDIPQSGVKKGAKKDLIISTKDIDSPENEEQSNDSPYLVQMLSESNSDLDRGPRYATIFEGESLISKPSYSKEKGEGLASDDTPLSDNAHQHHLSAINESQNWEPQLQGDPVIAGVIASLQNEAASSHSSEVEEQTTNKTQIQPYSSPKKSLPSKMKSKDMKAISRVKESNKNNHHSMDESQDWDLQTKVFSQPRKVKNTKRRGSSKVGKYTSPEQAVAPLSLYENSRGSKKSEDWDLQTQVFSKTQKLQNAVNYARRNMSPNSYTSEGSFTSADISRDSRSLSPNKIPSPMRKVNKNVRRNANGNRNVVAHPATTGRGGGSLLQAAKLRIPTPSSKVTQDSMRKNIESADKPDVFDFESESSSSCSSSEYSEDVSSRHKISAFKHSSDEGDYSTDFFSGSSGSGSSEGGPLDLHVNRSDASSFEEKTESSIWKLW